MKDINSVSPSIRDGLLKRNIGNYSMDLYKSGSYIGLPIDIHYTEPLHEKVVDDLKKYTDNLNIDDSTGKHNVRRQDYKHKFFQGKYEDVVDLFQHQDDKIYKETTKYKDYTEYIESKGNPKLDTFYSILSGSSFGLDINNGKVDIVTNMNVSDWIAAPLLTADKKDTKMGNLAKRSLAKALINRAIGNTQRGLLNKTTNWLLKQKLNLDDDRKIPRELVEAKDSQGKTIYDEDGKPVLTPNGKRLWFKDTSAVGLNLDSGITIVDPQFKLANIVNVINDAIGHDTRVELSNKASIFTIDNYDDLSKVIKNDREKSKISESIFWETQNQNLVNQTNKDTNLFLFHNLSNNTYTPNLKPNFRHSEIKNQSYDNVYEQVSRISRVENKPVQKDRIEFPINEVQILNHGITDDDSTINTSQIDNTNKVYSVKNDNTLDFNWNNGDNSRTFNSKLLNSTKENFRNKIKTLTSKFYDNSLNNKTQEITQSGVTPRYGLPIGRNLLKPRIGDSEINPYYRAYNHTKPYNPIDDRIKVKKDFYYDSLKHIRPNQDSFNKNSVINNNGFLHIAPVYGYKDDLKKYMFSIENLAWKDYDYDGYEFEKGNLGGRIMWFPPYDLKFNENTSVSWDSHNFIGRGEPIYTYQNTTRSGTLSFKILVDHPSILNYWKQTTSFKNDIHKEVENDILRFFVGGDTYESYVKPTNLTEQKEKLEDDAIEYVDDVVYLNLYFPDNYSGYGDINCESYLRKYESIDHVDSQKRLLSLSNIPKNSVGYIIDDKGTHISYRTPNGNSSPVNREELVEFMSKDYGQSIVITQTDHDFNGKIENEFQQYDLDNFGMNGHFFYYMDKLHELNNDKITRIEITGTTGLNGTQEEKEKLAERRALTTYILLSNKFGENEIEYIRNFDINPYYPEAEFNNSSWDEKNNRRANIKIYVQRSKIKKLSPDVENVTLKNQETAVKVIQDDLNSKYNEFDFFKELNRFNPKEYNKVKEKIQYFDPAFHSITPEGFNYRLTFLQQCTRQGPTTLFNNNNTEGQQTNYASNLAFGRPPICVLRVGDFYNTKIAINSLGINFDEVQWDFNQSGIGMQPMIANIDLGFNFIGGSDLSGPISRLQNAVSFNYFANTSVYDNRSDIVSIENEKPVYVKVNGKNKVLKITDESQEESVVNNEQ